MSYLCFLGAGSFVQKILPQLQMGGDLTLAPWQSNPALESNPSSLWLRKTLALTKSKSTVYWTLLRSVLMV